MERRKFLVGMGSVAAGSSALMGSNALLFAKSEREWSVSIAGDKNGQTKLKRLNDAQSKAYTKYDREGHLKVRIPRLNSDSLWCFFPLFKLGHQSEGFKKHGKSKRLSDDPRKYRFINKYKDGCGYNGGKEPYKAFDKEVVKWFCVDNEQVKRPQVLRKRLMNKNFDGITKLNGPKGGVTLRNGQDCTVGVCVETKNIPDSYYPPRHETKDGDFEKDILKKVKILVTPAHKGD